MYVDTDSKNSSRYLAHVSQSGLGLPDESYFRDEQHAEVLAAYPGHIARMFALVYGGASPADPSAHADAAARIVALETTLAAAHWDVVKRRDADLTYNLRTFADLTAEGGGFDWAGWVSALGSTPDAFAHLGSLEPPYLRHGRQRPHGPHQQDEHDHARRRPWRGASPQRAAQR